MKLYKRNSSQLVYLHSLLKTSLFRACVKEAVVFMFLILWLNLVHIFGPRKNKVVALYLFCVGVYPI